MRLFSRHSIWQNVTRTVPAGEISLMVDPSGTGKSVFLRASIGLLLPEQRSICGDRTDITACSKEVLEEIQNLFGSISSSANSAFVRYEHTEKSESAIKMIAMQKLDLVGLSGGKQKLRGESAGGACERPGLARLLVLDGCVNRSEPTC